MDLKVIFLSFFVITNSWGGELIVQLPCSDDPLKERVEILITTALQSFKINNCVEILHVSHAKIIHLINYAFKLPTNIQRCHISMHAYVTDSYSNNKNDSQVINRRNQ